MSSSNFNGSSFCNSSSFCLSFICCFSFSASGFGCGDFCSLFGGVGVTSCGGVEEVFDSDVCRVDEVGGCKGFGWDYFSFNLLNSSCKNSISKFNLAIFSSNIICWAFFSAVSFFYFCLLLFDLCHLAFIFNYLF
ncbi:hypothetical protein [Rice orange leaf phytoplasma]|uniref:hypothetical protein n=1 Tax=Rice orange leaf phytoplasma TaxID=146897 RepID=UPI00117A6C5F|nr:hypothetical protein [Rice orange leaf phytoplasma]